MSGLAAAVVEELQDVLGESFADAGEFGDVFDAGFAESGDGAEGAEKGGAAGLADSGAVVEDAFGDASF